MPYAVGGRGKHIIESFFSSQVSYVLSIFLNVSKQCDK